MPITDPTVATAIINAAKAGNAYKGEMPADDATKLKTADDLVALATQAKEAGVQGGPVMDVLAIAEGGAAAAPVAAAPPAAPAPSGKVTIVDQAGTEYEIDATQVDQYVNGSGQYQLKQVAPPAPPTPAPAPVPAPVQQAPEQTTVITQPVPAPTDINQIIPNYDDLKVTDILTAMEGLNDEAIAFVKAYEAAEGERGKIVSFERHQMVAPPAQTTQYAGQPAAPQAQTGVPAIDPAQYATVEPWQGFAKAKIKDIMENVDRVVREHPDDAKRVLAHVWEYEKSNKERTSLLNKLTTVAQQLQGGGAPPAAPAAPAPVPAEGADVQPTPPFASGGPVPPQPANAFVDQAPAAPAPVTPQPAPGTTINQPTSGANGLLAPLEGTTQRSTQAIIAEHLPIPPEVGQPPVLPADFTTLNEGDVARLQSQFNACLARAHYLCAVAEGHAADAKIVADGLLREYKAANPVPKGTTVDQHEAQAFAANPGIASARQVQNEWNGHARQLRALADTYQWNCERLSREQTRRSDERRVA